MAEYLQVLTTVGRREDAEALARVLLEKRLAACAQISGPVTSLYWWKGKIERTEEWWCLIKSERRLYGELEKALKGAHPYETPEVLAMPVVEGSADYLAWLSGELAGEQ
jgi:periplasmic divalent cation tolerance protein